MVIQKEIKDAVESQIELLITQLTTYLPFVKIAFPYSKDLSEACYSLIAGNALSVFLNQYAMRMKYPGNEDFTEFAKIVAKHRAEIDAFFK